jgi:hypothetical protein
MMTIKHPVTFLSSLLLFSCTILSVQAQQPQLAPPSNPSNPTPYRPLSQKTITKLVLKEAQQNWQFPKTGRATKIEPTNLRQIQDFLWISATIPTWKITLDSDDQRLVFITNDRGSVNLLTSRTNLRLSRQVPKSVIQAVQRSVAYTLNSSYKTNPTALQPYQVLIKEALPQQWPDGCLGKPKPGEVCTFSTVSGWRVGAEGKLTKPFQFRVDGTGRQIRSDLP